MGYRMVIDLVYLKKESRVLSSTNSEMDLIDEIVQPRYVLFVLWSNNKLDGWQTLVKDVIRFGCYSA